MTRGWAVLTYVLLLSLINWCPSVQNCSALESQCYMGKMSKELFKTIKIRWNIFKDSQLKYLALPNGRLSRLCLLK